MGGNEVKVDYSKQTLETQNPIARFAHRKRYELSLRSVLKVLNDGQTLLDYGCGKGDFLNKISESRKNAQLFGFDPGLEHSSNKYTAIVKIDDIEKASVDVFCSFETLEHLYPDEKEKLFSDAKRVLADSGTIFISVPIIGGPTLLLKELNRIFLFKRKSDYHLKELFLASFLGIPAKRPDNPRPTHKGFNFNDIERDLKSNFLINEKYYSPFSKLPWYLNSQVFYICKKKDEA